ncbi:MAG: M28 family peptidase [Oscillospiraceae bacterium]
MKVANKLAGAKTFKVDETVDFMVKEITDICNDIGPRAPGSPQELKAQEKMAESLKQWSDDVQTEEFTVHRQAFMGFIPFTVALGILASVMYWTGNPIIGIILVIVGLIPLVLEFVMYKQFIDPLFIGHPSHNVIAKRNATGEAKKRIIYVGHADSQYEWTLNYHLGGIGMKAVLIPAVVGMFVCLGANIAKFVVFDCMGIVNSAFWNIFLNKILFIALIIFVPFELAFLLFQSYTKSVPGANDNLTGCYCSMGVLKELAEADIRFEDTEVWAIMSGSEEAGLRGAKAYAKAHADELKEIETVVIACDTVRDLECIAVYDRDLSGTLKHDAGAKKLMKDAGTNCGLDLHYESVYIGGTDAAAFTQQGIRATGFAAMDPTPPRYYHTRLDNPEALVPEALKVALEVMVESACLYAENGLDA